MASFVVAAQLFLAAVFALAGAAKLFDPAGSRRAVADFGVPPQAARVIGMLLPLAELAIALALVLHPSARWAAAAALVLLLAFVAGVANAMRRGRDVDCGCFGPVYSATAGSATLVRNLLLAGLAATVLAYGGGPAIDDWVTARTAAELVAIGVTLAAVGLAVLSLFLLSRNRELRRRLAQAPQAAEGAIQPEGLPAGTVAPSFDLPDATGERRSLESLLAPGRPLILAFMESTCAPCNALMPDLGRWRSNFADGITIAVIAGGEAKRIPPQWVREVPDMLFDDGGRVFDAYNVEGTPKAIAIAPDGTVSGGPAGGLHMIEVLVRLALREGQTAGRSGGEKAAFPPVVRVGPGVARQGEGAPPFDPDSPSQPTEIAFEAFGVAASVSTPNAELVPQLRELVPSDSRPIDPSAVEHRFTLRREDPRRYTVRHIEGGGSDRRDGGTATNGSRAALRDELSTYLASHVDLDLALAVLSDHLHGTVALHAPKHTFIRAGVVGHRGGALLLPGMGLSGKTRLVEELVRAGATYYSDEYAAIDEQGLVHPYPSPGPEPLPIEAVILASYKPGAVWHPRGLSRGEAIVALISHAVPAQERPEETMLAITRALAPGPPTFTGDRGEADSVAPLLLSQRTSA
jgi:uncharacterized membrane protein YphA (DoxX/SURF4 family)/thiol-disulfide isomerase/thioredoxin